MSQKHKEGNTHPSEKPKVFPEDRRQYLLIRAQKDLRNEEGKKHMELLSSHVPPSSISNSRSLFFCTSFHLFPSLDWKAVNNKKKKFALLPKTWFHGQLQEEVSTCTKPAANSDMGFFLSIYYNSHPWTSKCSSCFQTGLLLAIGSSKGDLFLGSREAGCKEERSPCHSTAKP